MTTEKELREICEREDVRLSSRSVDGKQVYGLHGFLRAIQAVERLIEGYHIEHEDDGHYLYRMDRSWV